MKRCGLSQGLAAAEYIRKNLPPDTVSLDDWIAWLNQSKQNDQIAIPMKIHAR